MNFDQWSEDVWYWQKFWWKMLSGQLTHPEQLVLNNGLAKYLVSNSVPLAISLSVIIVLVSVAAMPFTFGRGSRVIVRAVGTVLSLVFLAVLTAFYVSPTALTMTGGLATKILGSAAASPPFPYLGKGLGPGIAYCVSTGMTIFLYVFMVSFATMIVISGSIIVLSWVCRLLGKVGKKQWQILASCFFTSHFGGILIIAAFIRLGKELVVGKTDDTFATFVIWVMLIIGIILVTGMFYLAYEMSTYLAGGRVDADSHNRGGDIDRINEGDRSDPDVHVQDAEIKDATIDGDKSTSEPSEVKVDENSATSNGVDISLRRDDGTSAVSGPNVDARGAGSASNNINSSSGGTSVSAPSANTTNSSNSASSTISNGGVEMDARSDASVSQSQTSTTYQSGVDSAATPQESPAETSTTTEVTNLNEVQKEADAPWLDDDGRISHEAYARDAYERLGLSEYMPPSLAKESEVKHDSPDIDGPSID